VKTDLSQNHPQNHRTHNQFNHPRTLQMERTIEVTGRVPPVFGTNHRVYFNPLPQARHRVHGQRTYDPHMVHKIALRAIILNYLGNTYSITTNTGPLTTSYVTIELTFLIKRPISHFVNGNRSNGLRELYQHTMPTTQGDIDNYVKFFLDAIDGIFFRNDRDVVSIKATKLYCNESHGRIIYNIRPYVVNEVLIDDENDDNNNNEI
jgi:Holliday junction resolvase RusA-like endonuclease